MVQLLETPFVNLINYASLVTTNAARHRFVAGKSKMLLEFGLRRAQVSYMSLDFDKLIFWFGFFASKCIPFYLHNKVTFVFYCRGLMVE